MIKNAPLHADALDYAREMRIKNASLFITLEIESGISLADISGWEYEDINESCELYDFNHDDFTDAIYYMKRIARHAA